MCCCKCKYWAELGGRMSPFGSCSNEKFIYECDFPTNDTPIDALLYEDYESYSASFYTGPEFGCIHFTPEGEL